jgi:hypothetical protein
MENEHVANCNYTQYISGTAPTGLNATTAIKVGTYGLLANGVKRGRILFQNAGSSSVYVSPNGPFSSSTQGFILPPGTAFNDVLDIRQSDDQWYCLGAGSGDDLRIVEIV